MEEDAPEEVVTEEAEVATEVEPEVTETEGEQPKKGSEARIRELNAKAKAAEQRAQSLEEKLAEITKPVGFQEQQVPQFNPQEPIVAPGEEIDAVELERRLQAREQRILAQADARSELRQKQSEAINRINSEASEVIHKYPQLNPESEQFDPELSDVITEAVEAYVKASPYTASVKQFTARLMKPYQGAVSREVGKATENIAKQVSQAAHRPTSIRKEEKTASEKSIAELEAELGFYNS